MSELSFIIKAIEGLDEKTDSIVTSISDLKSEQAATREILKYIKENSNKFEKNISFLREENIKTQQSITSILLDSNAMRIQIKALNDNFTTTLVDTEVLKSTLSKRSVLFSAIGSVLSVVALIAIGFITGFFGS